jgi:hypothetical protein
MKPIELKEEKPVRRVQFPRELWITVLQLADRLDLHGAQFIRRAVRNEVEKVRRELGAQL